MAVGAERRAFDVLVRHSRGQKLLTIGFHQVEENLVGQFAVTGGAGGEKEERIFFPDGIRVLHLVKQLVRIGKLRVKSCADFFSHLIAAALNARADCRLDIAGPGTEAAKHLANALLDNSLERCRASRHGRLPMA